MFIRRDSLLCKLCLVPSWVGRVGTHLEAAAPPLQPPVGGCSSLARHPPPAPRSGHWGLQRASMVARPLRAPGLRQPPPRPGTCKAGMKQCMHARRGR